MVLLGRTQVCSGRLEAVYGRGGSVGSVQRKPVTHRGMGPSSCRTPERAMKPPDSKARHDRTIMSVIIIQGVLFVVLIATGATLLYLVVAQFAPIRIS